MARDQNDERYDVEIQQEGKEASPKRARYHSGLLDMNTLEPGQDFDKLPESSVIFITKNDALGGGLPIYHIDRVISENGKTFKEKCHIIYVNAEVQNDTELGRLMHDLHCKNADDMYSDVLAEQVRALKETEEGVNTMCKELAELYNEGVNEGIAIGEERGIAIGEESMKREIVLSMAEMETPVEKIAQVVRESVDLVRQWIAEGTTLAKQ